MLFMMLSLLTGCSTITPGEVVVAVEVCDSVEDGGDMQMNFIRGGRYWPAFSVCTDYHTIPIRERRTVWSRDVNEGKGLDESIEFNARNGKVNMDVGLTWQVMSDDASIRSVITNFPMGIEAEIDGRVRDSVRDAFNMCAAIYTVSEIYAGEDVDPKTAVAVEGEEPAAEPDESIREKFFACAEKQVQAEYEPLGLNIKRISMNDIRLPKNVQDAMDATLKAAEDAKKAQEEVAKKEAEARSRVAEANGERDAVVAEAEGRKRAAILDAEGELELARLQAQANEELSSTYTTNMIKWKQLDIEMKKAEAWKGDVPRLVMGGDGSTSLIMQLDPALLTQ